MRSIAFSAALTAGILLLSAGPPLAADTSVACSLVTQAQIGTATGATIGAGTPISAPTTCQWSGQGKIVTLTITQTRSGKSPANQFADGKAKPFAGVTAEPVGGVGDDAYYVYFTGQNRAGCGLMVKKGSSVFEVRLYGFDLAQAKMVSKAIARDVAGKL